MKFSTREDIEASAGVVFAALSDFSAFERAAVRRGAEVSRTSLVTEIGPGMAWSLRFPVRGKMRRVVCTLEEFEPSRGISCRMDGSGFDGHLSFAVVALARTRTRLAVQMEIRPQTIAARLLIQAARLNRAAHTRRFAERVQKFAADIELRQAQQRGA